MPVLKVDPNGNITLPKELVSELLPGSTPGAEIYVEINNGILGFAPLSSEVEFEENLKGWLAVDGGDTRDLIAKGIIKP